MIFGNIGTSPIYAFGLAFDANGPFRAERAEIIGALSRNAQPAVDYFHLPVPQLVELGVQEEI